VALRFVIGPAGSGKTHWCLAEVRARAIAEPDGPPLILLVPEQASYQTEQALLSADLAGTLRARVFSFARLAQWVFSLGPVPTHPRLTDMHRRVLVASIVAELGRAGEPGSLFRVRGIEQNTADFLAEMKQFRLNAAELERLAQQAAAEDARFGRKLADLARAAREYERRLAGRFEDPEDTLASLRERVADLPELQGARVLLDGFYGFTPVELEVLRGLTRRCAEVVVTLPLDTARFEAIRRGGAPLESSRTFPAEETLDELLALAADDDIDLAEPVLLPGRSNPPPRFRTPALQALARRFLAFDRKPAHQGAAPGLRFVEACDAREEARLAVEQLVAWREAHGWRWCDMAVLARQLEPYAQPLDEALRAFRVPYFLDRHEPLETHPLIQGTLAALEAVLAGFRSAPILAFAKSGLFAHDTADVARLEEFVESWPVGRERWLAPEPWSPPPRRSPFEESARVRPADAAFESIDRTRRAVVAPLITLRNRIEAARTPDGIAASGFVEAICRLLHEARPDPDDETRGILGEVSAMLGALVESATDESFDDDTLLDLVQETFGRLTLPRIPPVLDQVVAGQVDRTRLPPAKGVVVLGLAEGVFPLPGGNVSLLTDRERDSLHRLAGLRRGGVVRASARRLFLREGFFALVALTRASEALTLVRPLSGEGGEAHAPSPYWEELRRLFPGHAIERPAPVLSRARARRGAEVAAMLCREVLAVDGRVSESAAAAGARVFDTLPVGRERAAARTVLASASRRNQARLDPALARRFLDGELRTSVSALESFAACPFQFFMRALIAPETAAEQGITPADIGNLAHATLKALADGLIADGRAIGSIRHEEIEPLVEACFRTPFERLEAAGLFATQSERVVAMLLREQLVHLVGFLAEAGRRLDARILAAESRFGPNQEIAGPRLTVPLPDGGSLDVVLRGQIDRIDCWRDAEGRAWLAVIDYKLSERRLEWVEAADGMSLQLAGYLLVLEQNRTALAGVDDVGIAGAFYVAIVEHEDAERLLRGVAPASAFAAFAFDADPVLLKGSADANESTPGRGDVISDAQFAALCTRAHETIARHARAIAAGTVAIHPALVRRETPCGNCDYRPACRLDHTMNSRRPVPALPRADVIERWLGPPGPR
jgi:ATP-dependent helicase/nuclease subunit B